MGRLFGTDGIRGIANEFLNCERAMHIGRAAAHVLAGGRRRRTPVVLLGMDTRISSDMLACAISAGLCSVGADVINVGVVPTPAVAYLVGKYKANAGIMISASHNPSQFNGIKIFNEDGFKLADELEEKIESIVLENQSLPLASGEGIGKVSYGNNAIKDYIDHLKSTVLYSLDSLNIAVDCANGSASATAKRLFDELGAKSHILFDKPDGVNINDKCGSTHMEYLQKYVTDNQLDAGIAFDGDADRCLCVDDMGNIVDGDMIMAITALDMKERGKLTNNTVVGTIITNFGFSKFCEQNNIRFAATKVGDRYVLEEMLLEDYYFGGEQSGHIIFRDFSSTGDGQLTAIQLLSHLRRSGKKLSELASVMERYPQISINIEATPEAKLAFYTNPDIKEALEEAKAALGKHGRLVVRPSGTEPLIRVMAEGNDDALIERVAQKTSEIIKQKITEC